MNKCNSIEAIDKTKWSEQTQSQLDEISKIENYFIEEFNQRKSCNKKLRKYNAAFEYIEKTLIVLSATTGGVSIISTIVINYRYGTSWNCKCKLYFNFFSINKNNKKIIEFNKKKKEKAW